MVKAPQGEAAGFPPAGGSGAAAESERMGFKSLITVITDPKVDIWALRAGIDLARRAGGHLSVLCLGIDTTITSFYYAGANALALQSSLQETERRAQAIERRVKEILAKEGGGIEYTVCPFTAQMPGLPTLMAHFTRFEDVSVLPRPYGKGRGHAHEAVLEAELFDAGIPVLVIPDRLRLPDPVDRIVIAWNESREALAAVRASLPLLKAASFVNIAMIDPPRHAPDRSDPGGALVRMLSHHGVKADVSILSKAQPRVSDVLARHVKAQKADLLVMGAYGHSRIRESILGGATRHMLQTADLPILMAH